MRQLFAILTLCCLLFLVAGYHLLYHYRITEAKQEMRQALLRVNAEGVSKLSFSRAELASLEWEDPSEFRYRGEMYDVLKVEKKGDSVVVWCLSDDKESALLNAYTDTQNQSSGSPSTILLKVLHSPYLPSVAVTVFSPEERRPKNATLFLFYLPQTDGAIVTPPPQPA